MDNELSLGRQSEVAIKLLRLPFTISLCVLPQELGWFGVICEYPEGVPHVAIMYVLLQHSLLVYPS